MNFHLHSAIELLQSPMNRFFILTVLFIAIASNAIKGQGKLMGVLADSATKNPIAYASVVVYNLADSAVVTFGLSDDKGRFQLSKLPVKQSLWLFISHVEHLPLRQKLWFDSTSLTKDFDTVLLRIKELSEVTISWERPPISIRNDTIEFLADAFINRPGSMAEDLIKRIPGISVSAEGKLLYQGRNVEKLTVDSKKFFSDDPAMLLKNLPAKAIDKVEISENKKESGRETNDGSVMINLTLKKWAKKINFGKAYVGGGTDSRYEAGVIWNLFRDTFQVSIIGYANNLSNAGFSFSDIYQLGGFQRSGFNQMVSYGDGNIEIDGLSFGGGRGITESGGGGFNLNYDFSKNLKVSSSYFMGFSQNFIQSSRNSTTIGREQILSIRNQTVERNNTANHNAKVGIEWNPNEKWFVNLSPRIKYNENITNLNRINQNQLNFIPSSEIKNQLNGSSEGFEFNNQIYIDREADNWYLSFYGDHNFVNNRGRDINLIQVDSFFNLFNPNELQRRSRQRSGQNHSHGVDFSYDLNDSFQLSIGASHEFRSGINDAYTYRIDPNNLSEWIVPEFSNQFKEELQRYELELSSSIKLKRKRNFRVGFTPGASTLNVENINFTNPNPVNRQFLTYRGWIQFRRYEGETSSYFYLTSGNRIPEGNQLTEFRDVSDPNFISAGNPNLTPSISHQFNGYYSKSMLDKKVSYTIYYSGRLENRAPITSQHILEGGISESRPVNLEAGRFNSSFGFSFSLDKRWALKNNWEFSAGSSLSTSTGVNHQYLNDDLIRGNVYSTGISPNFKFNKKDKLEMRGGVSFNYNQNDAGLVGLQLQTYIMQTTATVWWAMSEKNWLDISWNYKQIRNQSATSEPLNVNMLKVAYTRKVLKDNKGEIRCSVFDVLGQNRSVTRFVTGLSEVDNIQNTVTRYAMISFVLNLTQSKSRDRGFNSIQYF